MAKLTSIVVLGLVFVNTVLFSHLISAEIFSALSHTEKLLSIEHELSDSLEKYIQEQEIRLQKLKSFSNQVQRTVQLAKESGAKFLGHPVNSFLMIKRFVIEWPAIENILTEENVAEGTYVTVRFCS